jgi:hypothetical protein
MCFSAEANFGVAVALLPVGGYCLAAAWRKDRAYLPIAATTVLFGVQQLCEAQVWIGVGRQDPEISRGASLAFLFFALAVWPVWMPIAVAVIEPRGWRRCGLLALSGLGVVFGITYYLPLATDAGSGPAPAAVGHSLQYDFTAVPATHTALWWVWPALYAAAVCGPLLVSRDRSLRVLGAAVVVTAVVAYSLFDLAFVSVWCFVVAALSPCLIFVLYRLPDRPVARELLATEVLGNQYPLPRSAPPV